MRLRRWWRRLRNGRWWRRWRLFLTAWVEIVSRGDWLTWLLGLAGALNVEGIRAGLGLGNGCVFRVNLGKVELVVLALLHSDASQCVLSDFLRIDVVVRDVISSEQRDGVVLIDLSFLAVDLHRHIVVQLQSFAVGRRFNVFRAIKLDRVSRRERDGLGLRGRNVKRFEQIVLHVFGGNIVEAEGNLLTVGEIDVLALSALESADFIKSVELEGLVADDVAV